MKEFEDLLEDEEEDVVCGALDSSIKIIGQFATDFSQQPKTLEKQIAPILGKIVSLIQGIAQNKDSTSVTLAHPSLQSQKITDKIIEISGPLIQQINVTMRGLSEEKEALLGKVCDFINEQVTQAYETFPKPQTAESTAVSTNPDDDSEIDSILPPTKPIAPQTALIKLFIFNLPSYPCLLPLKLY